MRGIRGSMRTWRKDVSEQEQSTTNAIIISDRKEYDTTLDNYLANTCLGMTMGDVVRSRDVATNAKQYTVASMIYNAVFEMDVDLIRTIALRIDGTVPEEDKREGYANIIGAALEDVLSYEQARQLKVVPNDPPVIAMAKALVYVGTQPCGTNYAKRKERNLAAQMILERCGGRKVQPTRYEAQIEYVEPEWMQLGQGEEDSSGSVGDTSEQGSK